MGEAAGPCARSQRRTRGRGVATGPPSGNWRPRDEGKIRHRGWLFILIGRQDRRRSVDRWPLAVTACRSRQIEAALCTTRGAPACRALPRAAPRRPAPLGAGRSGASGFRARRAEPDLPTPQLSWGGRSGVRRSSGALENGARRAGCRSARNSSVCPGVWCTATAARSPYPTGLRGGGSPRVPPTPPLALLSGGRTPRHCTLFLGTC